MNCTRAQRATSATMDGEHLSSAERLAVESHVAGCAECSAFAARASQVRTAVRIRPAESVPDLTGRIMATVARGPVRPARRGGRVHPRRFLPAIAAAIAGLLVGSLVVGGPWASRSDTASAAEIAQAVRRAAPSVGAFQGSYAITEWGLAPDVPERRLAMDVAFLAPQRFRLDVRDETSYPSRAWTPTDVDYIQDMPATYLSGPTGCPTSEPVDCPPTRATVTHRSRYSAAAPLPADLIVPIATFGSADGVQVVGDERVDDHDTVHVAMTFARAAPLLPFLRLGGTWRPFYAQDQVSVWLDATGWYPVRIEVTPSTDPERDDWEMRFGLPREPTDRPILDVSLTSVSTAAPDPSRFAIPGYASATVAPERAAAVLGYTPAAPAAPGGLALASILADPGAAAPPSVLLYAAGLDYLRIGEDPEWSNPQPFGAVSADAERVTVPEVGPALYEPAGDGMDRRLSIHAADTDLFLESNLPRDELLSIASSLDVRSTALPEGWSTSRSGPVTVRHVEPTAALAELGLADLPDALPAGYAATSATRTVERGRVVDVAVTFRRLDTDAAGAPITLHGSAGTPGGDATPVRVGVALRATRGWYAPNEGSLTWSEPGRAWSLEGDVELSRLITIATAIVQGR